MRSIAELLEIMDEIVLWKDRRVWWINQCWLAGVMIVVDLMLGVIRWVEGEYSVALVGLIGAVIALVGLIRAIRGVKRAYGIIEKLKESMVMPDGKTG